MRFYMRQMATNLQTPIEKLRNVGPRNISRLHKLGIKTLKDLLWHFPVRYEDFRETSFIADIEVGEKVSIRGEVVKISSRNIFPRHLIITTAIIKDETGAISAVWFNQPYLENTLKEGTYVSLAGKVTIGKHGPQLSSPTYEKITDIEYDTPIISSLAHTAGLVPIYSETEGISSKYLRFLLKPVMAELEVSEILPEDIISKYDFPQLTEALKQIHRPTDQAEADKAKERLAFNDLFLFQIKALLERRKINQLKSAPIKFDQEKIKEFIETLPFELTRDQKVAAWEILKDLEKPYPMNRLMEGDVGSGKTVVALVGAVQTALRGYQTVFLAPTEILAVQHYGTISLLISGSKIQISTGLLTASEARLNGEKVKKTEFKKEAAQGNIDIIIGTHAVISAKGGPASGGQSAIEFKNLALVVIDEQHRFGIAQRAVLVRNEKAPHIPHLLSMTATPIPRTLALTIFGDLDISIIKEKPKNRQKIITKIIAPDQRKDAYDFIREEVKKDRQVFVVCPRIEISDPKESLKSKGGQNKMNILWAEVKAVEEEYEKLSEEIFPDLKVAMLHGRMKAKEKNGVMEKFKDGFYDILVSTSVIEVGVDIPNASIMMIESAERFGLAQLHQFRGRVGRAEHQSYCLLFTSTADRLNNRRLKALTETDDGFLLAEKDMQIRGPGEFFGVKQSGLPDLGMASLANVELIKKARLEARTLLKQDPGLSEYPLLKQELERFQKMTHFE